MTDDMTDDPFDLARFVSAQATTYDRALAELRSGHKRSHWMWFVFPQLAGLGHSSTAQHYGIKALKPPTPAQLEKLGPAGKQYVAVATHKPEGQLKAVY